jgi:uroporphyrinogen-III synthase
LSKNILKQLSLFSAEKKRRDELPEILKLENIKCKEIEVYSTGLNPREFPQEFDGILFFSPSAVQSFTAENQLKNTIAFCIGETTATEAKKHTKNIIIATKPSIENVIVQVAKYSKIN